jgi:hypothetical protein
LNCNKKEGEKIQQKYLIQMKVDGSLMNFEFKMKILIMGINIFCVTTKFPSVLRSTEFDRRFNSLVINRQHLLLSAVKHLLCSNVHYVHPIMYLCVCRPSFPLWVTKYII